MSLLPPPRTVTIEPTLKCNLNCNMCVRHFYKLPKVKDWTLDKLLSVVSQMTFMDIIQVGGNNEPLMYPYIFDFLNTIASMGLKPLFTTNGTLLKDDIISKIPMNSIMHVSIDGATEKYYKDIRHGSLQEILGNVTRVRTIRPDISVIIHHILFQNRILKARNLVDFAFKNKTRIRFMTPIIFSKEFEKTMSPYKPKNKFQSDLLRLLGYCRSLGLEDSMYSTLIMKEKPCYSPFTAPMIAINGDVYPCCYAYIIRNMDKPSWKTYYYDYEIEVPQYQYILGNVFKDHFLNIWKGDKWKKLKRLMFELNNQSQKNILNKNQEKNFDKTFKEYDPEKEFDYCKVCLSRWGRSE